MTHRNPQFEPNKTQTHQHTARRSFCLALAGIIYHVPFLHGSTNQNAPAWPDAVLSSRLDTQYASHTAYTIRKLLLLTVTQGMSTVPRALPEWHRASDRLLTSRRGHRRRYLHNNTVACAVAEPLSLATRFSPLRQRQILLKTLSHAGCCLVLHAGVVLLMMLTL